MTSRESQKEIQSWDEVPVLASEEEERAFWRTHTLGEKLLAQIAKGPPDPDLPPPHRRTGAQPISVRVDADLLRRLKAVARERNVGYQTLLKQWLAERLAIEETREMPPDVSASHVGGARLNTTISDQSEVRPAEIVDFDSLSQEVMRHLAVVLEGVVASIADVLGHWRPLPAGDTATRDSLAAAFDTYRRALDQGASIFRQRLRQMAVEPEAFTTADHERSPVTPTLALKRRGGGPRRRAGDS
jgi:hypothetical protein